MVSCPSGQWEQTVNLSVNAYIGSNPILTTSFFTERVFTSILLGMLLGLVIVGFNFQSMIEIVVTYVLFFWEHKSMKILILKNLIAHRLKNRMTAVIYSMALGTLIFIIVIANVQIKYVSQSGYFKQTDLYI